MMKELKIGFIGYGRHAKLNLYPALEILGHKIASISTAHEETAEEAGKAFPSEKCYSNYNEMLEKESLDCVFISLPTGKQEQPVIDSLEAGLDVFVEKSLGSNAKEAKEIWEVVKKSGRNLTVGFMKRHAPAYKTAKELTLDTRFGEMISMNQIFTSRNFVDDSKMYLLYAGIHYIDLIRYYLGEIEEVTGFETVRDNTLAQVFALKAENGATASLYFSASSAWKGHIEEIILTGKDGYIKIDGPSGLKYHFEDGAPGVPGWQTVSEEEISLKTMQTTSGGGVQSLYLQGFIGKVETFLDDVSVGRVSEFDAEENMKTMELYDRLCACL